MSTNWKQIGKTNRNSNNNEITFSKIISTVGNKTQKGVIFDISGDNISFGIGTATPFSRLSFGEKTGNGIINIENPGQLSAIALNENSLGGNFKGIIYNTDITSFNSRNNKTKAIQLLNINGDFSIDNNDSGMLYLTEENVTVVGGIPSEGNEMNSQLQSKGLKIQEDVGSGGNTKIVLDVKGSVRTNGYINFYNQKTATTFEPGANFWDSTNTNRFNNIPNGSLWLRPAGNNAPGGLYFKNQNGNAILISGQSGDSELTTSSNFFDGITTGDSPFIIQKSTTTGEVGGMRVVFSGNSEPKPSDGLKYKNLVTITSGNLSVCASDGSDNLIKNIEVGNPLYDPIHPEGGIIWCQNQLLIGKNKSRKGWATIDINIRQNSPAFLSYPLDENNYYEPQKATNSLLLLTKTLTDNSEIGTIYDASATIIIGGSFDQIDTPASIISNELTTDNGNGNRIIEKIGNNIMFGKSNDLSGVPFSFVLGADNEIKNINTDVSASHGGGSLVIGKSNELKYNKSEFNSHFILGNQNKSFSSKNSFIQGTENINYGEYNFIFGNTNTLAKDGNTLNQNNNDYSVNYSFCVGEDNKIRAPFSKNIHNAILIGKDIQLDLSHNTFMNDIDKSYVLLGSKASIKQNTNPDIRFAFGTKEKDGNVFTIDMSGNTRIYGNLVVDGSRVILNTEVLDVSDNNISLNVGGNAESAIGGGITLVGPSAAIKWNNDGKPSNNYWDTSGADISTNNIYVNDISANDASFNTISIGMGDTSTGDSTTKLHIQRGHLLVYGNSDPYSDWRDQGKGAEKAQLFFGCNNYYTGGSQEPNGIIWRTRYELSTKDSAKIVFQPEANFYRGGIAFYTTNKGNHNDDAEERMRIDMSGNVGIGNGANKPQSLLHLYKNTDDIVIDDISYSNVLRLTSEYQSITHKRGPLITFTNRIDAGGNLTSVTGSGSDYYMAAIGSHQRDVYNNTDDYQGSLSFYTKERDGVGGTDLKERMTITHEGKVGIGVVEPNFKLEVDGDISANVVYANDISANHFYTRDGNVDINGTRSIFTDISANDASFNTISTLGNARIGATTQDAYLPLTDISNSTGVKSQLVVSGGSMRCYIGSYYTSNVGSKCAIQASDFYTDSGENSESDHFQTLLLNPNGGYIGIGTDDPDEALVVKNKDKDDKNTYIKILNTDGSKKQQIGIQFVNQGAYTNNGNTTPASEDYGGDAYIDWRIVTGNDLDNGSNNEPDHESLYFTKKSGSTSDSNNVLVLNYDGNVGIGISVPDYKLEVDGDISANAVYANDISANDISANDISANHFYTRDGKVYINGTKSIFNDISGNDASFNNIVVSNSIVPDNLNVSIGTINMPIKELYVSNNSIYLGQTHKIGLKEGILKIWELDENGSEIESGVGGGSFSIDKLISNENINNKEEDWMGYFELALSGDGKKIIWSEKRYRTNTNGAVYTNYISGMVRIIDWDDNLNEWGEGKTYTGSNTNGKLWLGNAVDISTDGRVACFSGRVDIEGNPLHNTVWIVALDSNGNWTEQETGHWKNINKTWSTSGANNRREFGNLLSLDGTGKTLAVSGIVGYFNYVIDVFKLENNQSPADNTSIDIGWVSIASITNNFGHSGNLYFLPRFLNYPPTQEPNGNTNEKPHDLTTSQNNDNDYPNLYAGPPKTNSIKLNYDGSNLNYAFPFSNSGTDRNEVGQITFTQDNGNWSYSTDRWTITGPTNTDVANYPNKINWEYGGFGSSIDYVKDKSYVVVGAPYATVPYTYPDHAVANMWKGRIIIFKKKSDNTFDKIHDDTWGDSANDLFGMSVSFNESGDLLFVGAPGLYNNNFDFTTATGAQRVSVTAYCKLFKVTFDETNDTVTLTELAKYTFDNSNLINFNIGLTGIISKSSTEAVYKIVTSGIYNNKEIQDDQIDSAATAMQSNNKLREGRLVTIQRNEGAVNFIVNDNTTNKVTVFTDIIDSSTNKLEILPRTNPNVIIGEASTTYDFPLEIYGKSNNSLKTLADITGVSSGYVPYIFESSSGNISTSGFYGYGDIINTKNIGLFVKNSIWTDNEILVSSDKRIKENIRDISDNKALKQLRDISCVYYEYKDKISKGFSTTIGFIAQQVKEIMPMAVSIQKKIIPNEMREIKNPNWTEIIHNNKPKFKLTISDLSDNSGNILYRFYVSNDPSGNDECKKDIYSLTADPKGFIFEKSWNNVFIFGKEVNDFNTLDKQKLFALNFSATQEIDKQQQLDKQKIAALEAENATLKTQIADILSRLQTLENA